MSAGADGLVAKLVANGASQSEAERLAAEIYNIERSHAASLPHAMQQVTVPMPQIEEAKGTVVQTILDVLRFTSIGLLIEGIFELCDRLNVAVSLGVGVLAGFGVGGGRSLGIVFGPNRTVGWFSSIGEVLGWIASISGSVIMSGVHGGMKAFNGESVTLGWTAGIENPAEPVSPGVGLHTIYSMQLEFIGISFEISLSAGLSPIEIFAGHWETASHTVNAHSLPSSHFVQGIGI